VKTAGTLAWIAAGIFVLAAPRFCDRGMLNDLWNLAFAVILASAWNLLGGFAGQVSLGYSAFLGIGAYTTVLLSLKEVNPFITLPLGALLAAIFSIIIGLPAFRLRGPYFTIATIGVAEAVRVCATSFAFTGGSSGLRMPAGSFDFTQNYYSMILLAIDDRHRDPCKEECVRKRARRDQAGHRCGRGGGDQLDEVQADRACDLRGAGRRRRRSLCDQLPVHRTRSGF